MKKLVFLGSTIISILTPVRVFGADIEPIKITPPGKGYSDIGKFVTNALELSFILAILVVLVMLIWGAFEWITSGGDKDSVSKARNRIINALIGMAVLSIAFALFRVAAQFLGFDLTNIIIPKP